MNKTITGLGQASYDYIALTDAYPAEDTKQEVFEWIECGGGPVATALVSLSRLGVKTHFMGRVSDDRSGRLIHAGLKKEGVGTRGLKTLKGGKSQTAFIVVNQKTGGKRTIFWQRPTVAPLGPDEISTAKIRSSDMLLIDGLMKDASIRAAEIAKEAGVPVVFDAGTLRDGTLELLELSDFIVASERFACSFAGIPEKALKEFARFKPIAATVTRGEEGSVTSTADDSFNTPAFKVAAIDTTGAGDVFHGGYIYGLLSGFDMRRTVEFASAFAALKCLKPGGRDGIPTLDETLKLIKNGQRR